jgi:hypothetical protein
MALQDNILTAEELYGALNSPVLTAEEEYGLHDTDDIFGDLDDDVLEDEEEYTDDDDYEDDSDDFDEDETPEGYDPDEDEDELDEMLDDDDEYGTMPAAAYEDYGNDPSVAPTAYITDQENMFCDGHTKMCVNEDRVADIVNAFYIPGWLQPDWQGILGPEGEVKDILRKLISQPKFASWDSKGPKDQRAMIRVAMYSAMLPGEGDDSLRAASEIFDRIDDQLVDIFSTPGTVAKLAVAWAASKKNSLEMIKAMSSDFVDAVQGFNPASNEQAINATAYLYCLRNSIAGALAVVGRQVSEIAAPEPDDWFDGIIRAVIGETADGYLQAAQSWTADQIRSATFSMVEFIDAYDGLAEAITEGWNSGLFYVNDRFTTAPAPAPATLPAEGGMGPFDAPPAQEYAPDAIAPPAAEGWKLPTVPAIIGVGSAAMTIVALLKGR